MAEDKKMTLSDEEVATIEEFEIEIEEQLDIDTDEAFAALGEPNNDLNHALLNNRDVSDQHPITAITGLREELDYIESLKTVYSNKMQHANYYLWKDENLLAENRYGLFVSMCPETENLQICKSDDDVFGVTVEHAGFVGGQEYIQAADGTKSGKNYKYGLVVHSGVVGVRYEPGVDVGDYVMPNNRGEAKKTDGNYGYLVTSFKNINGVSYAMILLATPTTLTKKISDNVEDINDGLTTVRYNINAIANVANSAYALAIDAKENTDINSELLEEKIEEILGKVDIQDEIIGSLNESVSNANTVAAVAQSMANDAVSSANAIRNEAFATANEAVANVNKLIDKYEPIEEWVDPETGKVGASYVIKYMNENGLATKAEVETVETQTKEAFASIEKNAMQLQSLVSAIDKYCVGEYSQAYGLTHEQAKSILSVGMIYIPTIHHEGLYIDHSNEFSKGYYYTWDGEKWIPSVAKSVIFSSVYLIGSEQFEYWVVTEQDVVKDDITYDFGGLYLWDNGEWVKVSSVADNVLSRAISSIRQTADEIAAEVVGARGDAASLNIRLTNSDSRITTLASHVIGDYITLEEWDASNATPGTIYFVLNKESENQEEKNIYYYYDDANKEWVSTKSASEAGLSGTLATIEQKANDNGASIAQVVEAVGENGEVTAASIVTAINDGESSVNIDANHINFEADNYTINADNIDFEGSSVKIQAKNINLQGAVTFESFDEDTRKQIEADTIDVQIWSSRGNIFKSGDTTTILSCHVFKAGVYIKNTLTSDAFTWQKINDDGTEDTDWRATPHSNHANAIQISPSEVWSRAVFNCKVEI